MNNNNSNFNQSPYSQQPFQQTQQQQQQQPRPMTQQTQQQQPLINSFQKMQIQQPTTGQPINYPQQQVPFAQSQQPRPQQPSMTRPPASSQGQPHSLPPNLQQFNNGRVSQPNMPPQSFAAAPPIRPQMPVAPVQTDPSSQPQSQIPPNAYTARPSMPPQYLQQQQQVYQQNTMSQSSSRPQSMLSQQQQSQQQGQQIQQQSNIRPPSGMPNQYPQITQQLQQQNRPLSYPQSTGNTPPPSQISRSSSQQQIQQPQAVSGGPSQIQFPPTHQYTQANAPVSGGQGGSIQYPPTMQQQGLNYPPIQQAQQQQITPQYPPTFQGQQMQQGNYPTGTPFQTGAPLPPLPQQQVPRKVNPDQIPSPVTTLDEDQAHCDKQREYRTRSGVNPPLATSQYLTVDEGNASPRFMRLTTYNIPVTAELANNSAIPLGLVVQPFAELMPSEQPVQVAATLSNGPVRCQRCKTYMNPFMVFTHGGQKFLCNICGFQSDTPQEYFCPLDASGLRMDRYNRPELKFGVVDYVATQEFCLRKPEPANFVFIFDVSIDAIRNGSLAIAAQSLKEMLEAFPVDVNSESGLTPCKVAIIGFDRNIHFYNVSPLLSTAQIMTVPDLDDVFVPLHDGFLVNPVDSKSVLEKLLETLPKLHGDSHSAESCLGSAAKSAMLALKKTGGRIVIINSTVPTAGLGSLSRARTTDIRSLVNTDKEKQLYVPQQDEFYVQLAQECVDSGIGVDMFTTSNGYVDIASLGVLASVSGGNCVLYNNFRPEIDGNRLKQDIQRLILRPFGYDCILRVRCGNGLKVIDHFGNFSMKNSTDVEMGIVDSEKAIGVLFKHDGLPLTDGREISFQVALLYTAADGKRMVRCLNLSVPCTQQITSIFKSSDCDTTMNILTKFAVTNSADQQLRIVRDHLTEKCVSILAAYRKFCVVNGSPGQLILPESLKLLPVYIGSVLKSEAIRQQTSDLDWRVYLMRLLRNMPVATSMVYFYPRLFALHELAENDCEFSPEHNRFIMPQVVRCLGEKLLSDGIYLLDNGLGLWLWAGPESYRRPNFREIFGAESLQQINPNLRAIPILKESQINGKVRALISYIQDDLHKGMYPEITIVRQGIDHQSERIFTSLLVEDALPGTIAGNNDPSLMSYVDYLCLVHKKILDSLQDN